MKKKGDEKQQQQQQQVEIMAGAKKLLKAQRAFEKQEKQKEDDEKMATSKVKIKHHCSDATKILSMPELQEMVKDLINEGLIDEVDISLEQLKTWNRLELCRKLDSLLKLEIPYYNVDENDDNNDNNDDDDDDRGTYGDGIPFRDLINQANEEVDILPEWTKDQVSFEYMKTPYQMIGVVEGKIQSSTKHYDSATWSTLVNRALEVGSDLLDPTTRGVLIKHEDLIREAADVSHENDSMRVNLDLKNAIEEWIIRHTGLSEDQYDSVLKAKAQKLKLKIKRKMFRESLYDPFLQNCKQLQKIYLVAKRLSVQCFDDEGKIHYINVPLLMNTTWIVLILSAIREMNWQKEDCLWRVGQNGFWSNEYRENTTNEYTALLFTSVKDTLMRGGCRGPMSEQILQLKLKTVSRSLSASVPEMQEHPRICIITEKKVVGTFEVQFVEDYYGSDTVRQIVTESFDDLFERVPELNFLLPTIDNYGYWWSGTGASEHSLRFKQIKNRGGFWGSNDPEYLFVGRKLSEEVTHHMKQLNQEFVIDCESKRDRDITLVLEPLVSHYNHTIDSLTNLNKQPTLRINYYETHNGIDRTTSFEIPIAYKNHWKDIMGSIEHQLSERKIEISEQSQLLVRFGEYEFWKPIDFFQMDTLYEKDETFADFVVADCLIKTLELAMRKSNYPRPIEKLPKIDLIMNEISYGIFDIQPNSQFGSNGSESFREFFTRNRLLDLWNTITEGWSASRELQFFMSGYWFAPMEKFHLDQPVSDYIKYTGREINTVIVGIKSIRKLAEILGPRESLDLVDVYINYSYHSPKTKSVTIRKSDVYNVKLRELFEKIGELENNDRSMFTEQHLHSIKFDKKWRTFDTIEDLNNVLNNDNISDLFLKKKLKRKLRQYEKLIVRIRLKGADNVKEEDKNGDTRADRKDDAKEEEEDSQIANGDSVDDDNNQGIEPGYENESALRRDDIDSYDDDNDDDDDDPDNS
jgi:hypothetical protein